MTSSTQVEQFTFSYYAPLNPAKYRLIIYFKLLLICIPLNSNHITTIVFRITLIHFLSAAFNTIAQYKNGYCCQIWIAVTTLNNIL